MKKILSLLVVLLSVSSTYGFDIENMNLDMNFDSNYGLSDNFEEDLNNSLNESFLNWETNFESMMKDFENNLQNNLSNMEKEINSMMETFSTKIDEDLADLNSQIEEITSELPTKLVNKLDSRLEVLFDSLEKKLGNTDEYMDLLNKLTDRINILEDSGKITNDVLKDALNLIELNTDIQKNLIVMDNIDVLSGLNTSDLVKGDLESLKGLFDGLGLSY